MAAQAFNDRTEDMWKLMPMNCKLVVEIEINRAYGGCKIKIYIYLYVNVAINEVPRAQIIGKVSKKVTWIVGGIRRYPINSGLLIDQPAESSTYG